MGSGKTTVGRLLADATRWPRYDNDQLLDQLYGMTARQIIDARGEQEMRDAENAALALGLTVEAPCIIDAAAGTIMSEPSRQALREPIVIWLRAAPETLFRRAMGAAHRPFLDGGEEWVRATAAKRSPLYASVADIVVEVDDRPPAEIAAEALTGLRRLCSGLD